MKHVWKLQLKVIDSFTSKDGVYKVKFLTNIFQENPGIEFIYKGSNLQLLKINSILFQHMQLICLLYTSDAADDTPCVDLGGRRIIKKKKK